MDLPTIQLLVSITTSSDVASNKKCYEHDVTLCVNGFQWFHYTVPNSYYINRYSVYVEICKSCQH